MEKKHSKDLEWSGKILSCTLVQMVHNIRSYETNVLKSCYATLLDAASMHLLGFLKTSKSKYDIKIINSWRYISENWMKDKSLILAHHVIINL